MRFTIRDLLWLTVVVALGVGWWVDRGRLAHAHRQQSAAWRERWNDLVVKLHQHGWTIQFSDDYSGIAELTPPKGEWLRFPEHAPNPPSE